MQAAKARDAPDLCGVHGGYGGDVTLHRGTWYQGWYIGQLPTTDLLPPVGGLAIIINVIPVQVAMHHNSAQSCALSKKQNECK